MLVERARAVVFHGPEEGTVQDLMLLPPAVFRHCQILPDQPLRHRVNGNKADLVALALDAEMHHALAALHVAEPQQAQLLAADAVIEQGGEYRAIPYTLQRVRGRGLQQPSRLGVAQGGRAAFIAVALPAA